MTKKEAIKAMLEGKKARKKDWETGKYIYYDDKSYCFLNEEEMRVDLNAWIGDDWEIYENKVDKWLWAYRDIFGQWVVIGTFYSSVEELELSRYVDKKYPPIKLEATKITVEEE